MLEAERPRTALGAVAGAAIDPREKRTIRAELSDLERIARLEEPPPPADAFVHLALIPTYTEPLEKLRADRPRAGRGRVAEGPQDLRDHHPRDGRGRHRRTSGILREEFGDAFADFIHILDPLEPGIVIGKSSAMAWGGKYLYRLLVRERDMDPHQILITDLDADFRVHPQYFAYLTWMHLSDPNRETQLYQPIPYFHNNLWRAPVFLRLFAAVLTQLQMWRSVLPEKLQSFSSLLDDSSPHP